MTPTNYKRNGRNSSLQIIIGLMLISNLYLTKNFILSYHGLMAVLDSILIIMGLWGIYTPIAYLTGKEMILRISLIKTLKFDLSTTKTKISETKDSIQFSDDNISYKLRLNLIKSFDREKLLLDMESRR